MNPDPKERRKLRYSICVSGAASGKTVDVSATLAERVGTAIAKHGHVTLTGATVGLPYRAAMAAKQAGGMSIGFSPASDIRDHLRRYRLPRDAFDFISYTGMHYVGRDLYLIQSSDAVITIGGRFGSLHEFVSALEAHKPCGVLLNSSGTADIIPELMKVLEPPREHLVIYDDNPERLVERIIAALEVEYKDIHNQLEKDEHWYLGGNHRG